MWLFWLILGFFAGYAVCAIRRQQQDYFDIRHEWPSYTPQQRQHSCNICTNTWEGSLSTCPSCGSADTVIK